MSANKNQIGGSHYNTGSKPQHWDLVYEYLEGDYLLGAATKYIFRFGKKGDKLKSIEDLQKAIHFIEKKIEMTEYEIALEYEMQPDLFEGDATSGYVNQDR